MHISFLRFFSLIYFIRKAEVQSKGYRDLAEKIERSRTAGMQTRACVGRRCLKRRVGLLHQRRQPLQILLPNNSNPDAADNDLSFLIFEDFIFITTKCKLLSHLAFNFYQCLARYSLYPGNIYWCVYLHICDMSTTLARTFENCSRSQYPI